MHSISRRQFLRAGAYTAGGAALTLGTGATALSNPKNGKGTPGFGELEPDPGGLIDLPRGFQYRLISAEGDTLSNGAPVPADHDGMAAFRGPGGSTVLVRNHELSGTETPAVAGSNPFDPAQPGGTTGIILDPSGREVKSFVTSSGSQQNCAGGATPWGTWITCEETRTDGHGYAFEVDPRNPENDLSKTPITDMGFFSHEAVDIDPRSGIAYLTEDDFRGVIDPTDPTNDTRSSFLYRYLPNDRRQRPGALQRGGELQALAIEEAPGQDADFFDPGQRFGIVWRTVDPTEPHDDALAKGCVRFNRLEGCHMAGGAFWFSDTAGGEARLGQIYRYAPATETLELFFEATDANDMESPDNIVVTPWGDLWFCEDGDGEQRVMGITPHGKVYKFASNRLNESEFAGCTFGPDGTFYVNIQSPGLTFVINGPFRGHQPGRTRRLAAASPPRRFAPRLSGELGEAARRHGLTELEAAAYERLGVALT
jgi:hypothetical protein